MKDIHIYKDMTFLELRETSITFEVDNYYICKSTNESHRLDLFVYEKFSEDHDPYSRIPGQIGEDVNLLGTFHELDNAVLMAKSHIRKLNLEVIRGKGRV